MTGIPPKGGERAFVCRFSSPAQVGLENCLEHNLERIDF